MGKVSKIRLGHRHTLGAERGVLQDPRGSASLWRLLEFGPYLHSYGVQVQIKQCWRRGLSLVQNHILLKAQFCVSEADAGQCSPGYDILKGIPVKNPVRR
jgi:hypothetical protein